jgi:drug/metabolite transporter (DMT)-like permease
MSRSHVFPLILAAACWGIGAVATKDAVTYLPPVQLLVVQLASSLAILGAILVGRPRSVRPSRRVMLLGILNPGAAYLLNLLGLVSVTAGLSVLMWALEPVLILLLSWLWLGQRIGGWTAIGALVAVSGAALAATAEVSGGASLGVALTVAAVAACAVYTLVAGEWAGSASSVAVVVAQQASALVFALVVLAVTLLAGESLVVSEVPPRAWFSAVGSGVLYYGLAFWAFLTGLRRTTPATGALFLTLIPVFGVGGGALWLDERVSPPQLFGGGLVVLAVGAVVTLTPLAVGEPLVASER